MRKFFPKFLVSDVLCDDFFAARVRVVDCWRERAAGFGCDRRNVEVVERSIEFMVLVVKLSKKFLDVGVVWGRLVDVGSELRRFEMKWNRTEEGVEVFVPSGEILRCVVW